MARLAILTAEFAPFRGGIATYAESLAAAAQRLGHEVTVFAPDYGRNLEHAERRDVTYRVHRFRAGAYGPWWYPRYAGVALDAVRNERFEQVLAADIPFIELLAATRMFHRFPYIAAVHGSEVKRSQRSLRGLLFAPARIFAVPSHVFTNSRFTRELLLESYPAVDPERVSVAYLGVAETWFEPGDPTHVPPRLETDKRRRLIVSVARITPRKGQLTLVRAIADMVPADRARLALVLVGAAAEREKSYLSELHCMAEKAKPAEIIIAGSLDDVEIKALYSNADVFCLPGSQRTEAVEGFGLVFLEAAAQGIAAIAGAVGGVPEVVRDGETGMLVPPDDPTAIGAALNGLLKDREHWKRMGAAARSHARSFTWERCARETFGEA